MPGEGLLSGDVLPVVRSSGERTAARCKALLASILGCEPLTISETPLDAALRVTFERALDSQCEWLLTYDADVVPIEGEVEKLVALAHQIPDHYYLLVGQVRDKLFGGTRPGSLGLYRTRLLPRVLQVLPASNPVRPESGLYGLMADRGHPVAVCNVVGGHHGFEQFYRDVYRTSYFHVFKNAPSVIRATPTWRMLAQEDPDFRVALLGAANGLMDPVSTSDTSLFDEVPIAELLHTVGLTEKAPIDKSAELHLGTLPAATSVRWRTAPFPAGFLSQAREYRRCNVSVTREIAKRVAVTVANRVVDDPDNRYKYRLPDLLA